MKHMQKNYVELRIGSCLILCLSTAILPLTVQQISPAPTAPSDSEVIQLAPFSIIADTDAGYRPTHTNVLTRTNRPLIDLPQSVDILPAEFLLDTGARMMDEAFVYVGNAQVRNSSAGTVPNNILIRGFANCTSYTDGIDTGTYRRDLFGYECM